ncbi:MAG: (2Fe-2S)-binding protein [Bacillota bacterium]
MVDKNNVYICRCEEVTREEIEQAIKTGATSINEVKKWTRAGMGLCQGKICSKNVSRLISEISGTNLENVLPATSRQPVRPVRIEIITEKE